MIDLQALRPKDSSPPEIRAAIARAATAAGHCARELADAKKHRGEMLLVGSEASLTAAEQRLASAFVVGQRIEALHGGLVQLEEQAAQAEATLPARLQTQVQAVAAVAAFAAWWEANGPSLAAQLTNGLELMAGAAAAAATLAQAESIRQPVDAGGNVVPITNT